MSDGDSYYKRDPRFTLSSALLLIIFVGAVLFVLYVGYRMAPWDGDDDGAADATVAETAAPTIAPDDAANGEEIVETAPEGAE